MYDLIASTDVSYRALTMPSFMDNILNQIEPDQESGHVLLADLWGPQVATCATRDIAASRRQAAARSFLEWTGHRPDTRPRGPVLQRHGPAEDGGFGPPCACHLAPLPRKC
jgi:hypothetical protein